MKKNSQVQIGYWMFQCHESSRQHVTDHAPKQQPFHCVIGWKLRASSLSI